MECKFYKASGGCRFGNKCHFIHATSKSAHVAAPVRPPIVPSSSFRQAKSNPPNESPKEPMEPAHVNSLWNFADTSCGNEDGVFFYGAPGQFQQSGNIEQDASYPSYSKVAKQNIDPDALNKVEDSFNVHKPTEVCRFYLLGNCKFGSYCKYLHIPPESSSCTEGALPRSEVGEDSIVECGICIEAPKTSLYGILSHCDCKFCLECIRNWRKEGLTIAKKADQVR